MKRPARSGKTGRAKKSRRGPWWTRGVAIGGIVFGGLMLVAFAGALSESPHVPRAASARANPTGAFGTADPRSAAAEPPPRPPVNPALARAATPVGTPAASAAHDATAASDTAGADDSSLVTMTGCLDRSDEAFRLVEASGTQVPKARSWKTGFLRKKPASVAVVSAANRVNLSRHIGQRVSVTGTLVDREMRVRSLQSSGASCGGGTKGRQEGTKAGDASPFDQRARR
jgi:hypothetical protein